MALKKRANQAAAVLDGLESPSVTEVADAMVEFDAGDVAVAAAHKALEVGLDASVFQQDTDPGAVGAGSLWVNTSDISNLGLESPVSPVFVRNAANDGWLEQGFVHRDEDGNIRAYVAVSDSGVNLQALDAEGNERAGLSVGSENVTVLRYGNAYIQFDEHGAYILTFGLPIWLVASPDNIQAWGISAPSGAERFFAIGTPDDSEVANDNLRVHWYDGTAGAPALRFKQTDADGTITSGKSAGLSDDGTEFKGVAKPSIETPSAAAIIAALVTLGLVVDDT